jgi:hypothetical protein
MDDKVVNYPCKCCESYRYLCYETCDRYIEWQKKFRDLVSEYAKTSAEDCAKRLWGGRNE